MKVYKIVIRVDTWMEGRIHYLDSIIFIKREAAELYLKKLEEAYTLVCRDCINIPSIQYKIQEVELKE